ncbi:unnamed protein product [Cylindrotheca closterium]|uniref:tRNA pseudouridine synthase n=1 Tax=Cylindrotheca closterium TaxID=2856 RepID=A0AAD2CQJ7_9STRA|nr:unnamed protein product [Cylindrotheca closterium]
MWLISLSKPTVAFLPTRIFPPACHAHGCQDNFRQHDSFFKSDSSRQKSRLYGKTSGSDTCDALDSATAEKVVATRGKDKTDDTQDVLTNAVIRVSFDGRMFTGWSGANDNSYDNDMRQDSLPLNDPSPKIKRKRRRRLVDREGEAKGYVRSVEGVIRANLAQIYGNVDPRRVIVEGCSRTDKGVHATGMMAHIYCLTEEAFNALQESSGSENPDRSMSTIKGKRIPHPTSPTDQSYFEPIPKDANLSRMAFALNRMRPQDVQISGIAPAPFLAPTYQYPFHASLSSVSKTYEYRVSIGDFQDPTLRRSAWFLKDIREWKMETIRKGCEMLRGTHDFSAFQGSARGAGDRKKQKEEKFPTCTLFHVDFVPQEPSIDKIYFPGLQVEMFRFVITGDRFLYKMSRMIVGALVALGSNRLDLDTFERAIESGNWDIPETPGKRVQFQCAPPHGLVLESVQYDDIDFDWQPLRY